MGASRYVGRVGGLAVALGIGAALAASQTPAASADTGDTSTRVIAPGKPRPASAKPSSPRPAAKASRGQPRIASPAAASRRATVAPAVPAAPAPRRQAHRQVCPLPSNKRKWRSSGHPSRQALKRVWFSSRVDPLCYSGRLFEIFGRLRVLARRRTQPGWVMHVSERLRSHPLIAGFAGEVRLVTEVPKMTAAVRESDAIQNCLLAG